MSDNEGDGGNWADDIADYDSEADKTDVNDTEDDDDEEEEEEEDVENEEDEENKKNVLDTEDVKIDIADREAALKYKEGSILRYSNTVGKIIVINPDDRRTTNILQQFELARIISMRSKQIQLFQKCFTDVTGLVDSFDQAVTELYDRKCPYLIRRYVGVDKDGNKFVEHWNPNEMVLPPMTQ